MKELRHPVGYSIVSTVIIFVLFFAAHAFIPSGLDTTSTFLLDSALRLVFTVPILILLGYIVHGNGFRFAFAANRFSKGLFACAPMLLFTMTIMIKFLNMTQFNQAFLPFLPAVVLQQLTTGIFEESLFRGLFMTAMLREWSGTLKGRILPVLISGTLFGAAHLTDFLSSGDAAQVLRNALLVGLFGFGVSASYLYSGNLACCIFIHALWDIAVHLSNGLIAGFRYDMLWQIANVSQALIMYVVFPLFSVYLCVKAKPFYAHPQCQSHIGD